MSARVIVTRPLEEAQAWSTRLQAAGRAVQILPLIEIAPADANVQPGLRRARSEAVSYRALMFVSAAAVRHFFDGADVPALGAVFGPRCWATGPGTVAALRRAGVPPALIDAPAHEASSFDSEALWALVGKSLRPGDRVLLVRGGDAEGRPTGRDWLALRIEGAGARCDQVVAYRRCVPAFGPDDEALARSAATDRSIWLFSSSEAVGNLCGWLPDVSWNAARAVGTHERIAEAARQAGFGVVLASSPRLEALIASIESFR